MQMPPKVNVQRSRWGLGVLAGALGWRALERTWHIQRREGLVERLQVYLSGRQGSSERWEVRSQVPCYKMGVQNPRRQMAGKIDVASSGRRPVCGHQPAFPKYTGVQEKDLFNIETKDGPDTGWSYRAGVSGEGVRREAWPVGMQWVSVPGELPSDVLLQRASERSSWDRVSLTTCEGRLWYRFVP